MLIYIHHEFLQDLPDVQELIAEVNAEKYSLQAAAILGASLEVVKQLNQQSSSLLYSPEEMCLCFRHR